METLAIEQENYEGIKNQLAEFKNLIDQANYLPNYPEI